MFKVTSILGLLIYLISILKFPLLADDLPLKVDCENQVCNCYRITDTTVLDIDNIIGSINKGKITDSILIACCYHQIALEYYYEHYDDLSSLKYNKKAKEIREKYNDGLLWRSHLNIGLNYYGLNEYKLAFFYLKKALSLSGDKDASDSLTIFKHLAEYYLEIGDYETAINYSRQSLPFNVDKIDKSLALNTYSSILISSQNSKNLTKAKDLATKAFELSKTIQDYDNMKIALNNIAKVYTNTDSFDKAISIYKKAIELSNYNDTIPEINLLNNLANAFCDKKDFNLAINTLGDSYNLLSKYYQTDFNYEYAPFHENIADIYTTLQQIDTALLHYQKSLINLTNNFRNEDIFQNPNPKDTTLFIYSNPDMIRVLHLKATAAYQYYKKNNNIQYLNLANQTYQTAFDFHDKLQKDISTENSRLFQAKNIISYIENALNVAYQQQENGLDISKTAFRFMEKNKATVLLQSMNEADALQFANIPDTLLEQEKDLKIAITFHKKQLNEAIEYEEATEIERLEKILFEEKQQYSQLINNLENNYPDYYQLKYQQNQTQLIDVQQSLDDQAALFSYFVGDSAVYTLLILKDKSQLFKTKKPAEWNATIKDFREALTLSNPTAKANPYTQKLYDQFVNNAHTLFQLLLKEPLETLNGIAHLQIIPDAELNYIPFDLLLTDKAENLSINYKTLPYLLKQKTISYHYSASLMMEQVLKNSTEKSDTYGGYAAQYSDTDSVDVDLPEVRQLVKDMASFFKGKSYLSEEATKLNFLKDTSSYQILHLAMHGKLNDQYPLNSHLVFTKNTQDSLGSQNIQNTSNTQNIPNTQKENFQLYAADLYQHQLKTDLAVLSACETGTGTLQKGEGVMSLSRAFTYAGCPSLVMSLWSIPEKSSAEVLQAFFENIKKQTAKDVALQQAKLNYLENTSATKSHPAYWAGLVLTGNTEAMHFESVSNRGVCCGFVLLLVLISGFFFYKKSHTNQNSLCEI